MGTVYTILGAIVVGILLVVFGIQIVTTNESWAAQDIGMAFIGGGLIAIIAGAVGIVLVIRDA